MNSILFSNDYEIFDYEWWFIVTVFSWECTYENSASAKLVKRHFITIGESLTIQIPGMYGESNSNCILLPNFKVKLGLEHTWMHKLVGWKEKCKARLVVPNLSEVIENFHEIEKSFLITWRNAEHARQ